METNKENFIKGIEKGNTIKVLKEILMVQETDESNGEPTLLRKGSELVIYGIFESYFYAKNEIANRIDDERINKRKFIVGFNELFDLVKRDLVKIK